MKGIDNDLEKVISRAEDELEEEVSLYKIKNGLSQRKHFRKFPSFLKLSGQEKTTATLYRSNLYGALKISIKEKVKYFEHFMKLV